MADTKRRTTPQRRTIGASPLDLYYQSGKPEKADQKHQPDRTPPAPRASARAKVRMTIHVSAELNDLIGRAAYWTPGLTISELAERALKAEVDGLERTRGEAFPPIPEGQKVRTGRPVKARDSRSHAGHQGRRIPGG